MSINFNFNIFVNRRLCVRLFVVLIMVVYLLLMPTENLIYIYDS